MWLAAVDLSIAVPAIGGVIMYGTATLGLSVVITVARIAVWIAALERMLAPVSTWLRGRERGEVDDATLLAADSSLHRVPLRFVAVYGATWVASLLALLLLSAGGLATTPSQQVGACFSALSIVMASVLLVPIFRYSFDELYHELAREILARGLASERPRTPLIGGVVRLFLLLMMAMMLGLAGTTVRMSSGALTAAAKAEQRELVALDAQRFELVAALPPGDEVEVVGSTQLPAPLEHEAGGGPRAVFDPSGDEILAAAPLADGRWVLRRAPHRDRSWLLGLVALVAAILSLFPTALAGVALNRVLLRPLRELDEAASSIAAEGLLIERGRIVAPFDDEIGDLGRSFNAMLDMLEQVAAAAASVTAGDLCVELEGRGDLQDAFRSMVAELDEVVWQIRMTSLEVASAAAEIQAASQDQERATQQQAASVREVGATVSSLAGSADAISAAARGVFDNAAQTRTTAAEASAHNTALSAQIEGIRELLELIREVGDRSDLLALNGSLEAVRAGESGRGFALVASEMRRLAERVTLSVDDVAAQVSQIQSTSEATVAANERSHALAGDTAEAAESISRETHGQGAAMEQLSATVEQLTELAAATSQATANTRSTAEGLKLYAEQLERLTAQFKTKDSHGADTRQSE